LEGPLLMKLTDTPTAAAMIGDLLRGGRVLHAAPTVVAAEASKGVGDGPELVGTGEGIEALKELLKLARADTENRPGDGKAAEANGAESETAQIAKQGLAALQIPSKLWEDLESADRNRIASNALSSLFAERKRFAHGISWVYAPEIELLDRCAQGQRQGLAKRLFESRAGIADYQLRLEAERLEVVRELRGQIHKWTSIAGWGLGLLVFGFLMMLAALGGLMFLVAQGKLSGWALPAAIFALALFAISPAVLLLRERPLEGLDKWMPAGKAEDEQEAETASSSTEKSEAKTS
jgi:hypothetical protein